MIFMYLHRQRTRSKMETTLLYPIISDKLCPERTTWSKKKTKPNFLVSNCDTALDIWGLGCKHPNVTRSLPLYLSRNSTVLS